MELEGGVMLRRRWVLVGVNEFCGVLLKGYG